MSVWIMPIGFRPRLGAIMQRVAMIPTTPEGPEYKGDGTLVDVAIPQLRICTTTMTVSPVDVTLHGLGQLIGDRRTSFQLEIAYGAGSVGAAGTGVSCPHVGGGTSDTFSLDPLLYTFPPEGGAVMLPHVLHAHRIGDIVGRTVIVVTQGTAP